MASGKFKLGTMAEAKVSAGLKLHRNPLIQGLNHFHWRGAKPFYLIMEIGGWQLEFGNRTGFGKATLP